MEDLLRGKIFEDEDELWKALRKEWNNVLIRLIESLSGSLPNRARAVWKAC